MWSLTPRVSPFKVRLSIADAESVNLKVILRTINYTPATSLQIPTSGQKDGKYLNRRCILLVDDNRTHQYSLGRHLDESGFEVLHAHTGEEAIKLASSRLPALMLLDVNLPDMSGFQICETLKADLATRAIPVIFHSATHDTQSARLRAIDLGAVSFLSYPVDIEHLLIVIRGTLAHGTEKRDDEEI